MLPWSGSLNQIWPVSAASYLVLRLAVRQKSGGGCCEKLQPPIIALLDTVVKPPSLISRVQHGNIDANHNCTCDAAFGLVVGFELGVAGDYGNALKQWQSYSDEKTGP
ncbi:hypothetical protein Landi51_06575 [Colletotrichum acutatum]